MLIIGELINASRKPVAQAIREQDGAAIAGIAAMQHACGAGYIDVNAGVFADAEADHLAWLVQTVQKATGAPCCIDSPSPAAIEAALAVHQGTAMINSISLEEKRCDAILPVIAGTDLKVIALCMSDDGMPETVDQRMAIADRLVNRLVGANVPVGNIYVDPLVQPVATNSTYGTAFLNTIETIMAQFPGIHTVCGLSNISYGLPERKLLNQCFVVMAVLKGLDAAIINPTDKRMVAHIAAAEALAGRDNYCAGYLSAFRAGKLELS